MPKRGRWKKGLYQVVNNDKYVGKRPIVCRSSWEFNFCRFLDHNHNVIEWASESKMIRYYNPIKGKISRYYPDFAVKYKDPDGNEIVEIIEIKPFRQTQPPKPRKNKKKSTLIQEMKTYAVNSAKWESAIEYCKPKGIIFRVITEKDLQKYIEVLSSY